VVTSGSPAPKMRTSAGSWQEKGLAWKAVAQSHVPMALLAQRQRDWGCLLVLPLQTSNVAWEWRVVPATLLSQPCSENANVCWYLAGEGASGESYCSASSAEGTARTEAQRLGLLACLATSNFQHILGGSCLAPPTAVLQKFERLQIACSQKGLA